jgi:hypothetical protein
MQAFYTFLGGNDMMAYLTMMSSRLVELRRVLKPTGSLDFRRSRANFQGHRDETAHGIEAITPKAILT